MEQVPDPLLGNTWFTGLRSADPQVLSEVKSACYKNAVRAVERAGGSYADGDVFYRTALVELLHQGEPAGGNAAWPQVLEALSVAHFESWIRERKERGGEEIGGERRSEEENGGDGCRGEETGVDWRSEEEMKGAERGDIGDEESVILHIPAEELLRQTRRHIFVWNRLLKLPQDTRLAVIAGLGEGWDDVSIAAMLGQRQEQFSDNKYLYFNSFRESLRLSGDEAGVWPDWVYSALKDTHGWALWQALEVLEEEPETPGERRRNKLYPLLFIVAMVLMLGYIAYSYLVRSGAPAEVFEGNFNPPESLISDHQERYGPELGNDSVSARPNACEQMIRQADFNYQKKKYDEAQDALLLVALDPDLSLCHGDAWFYLGIIRLERNDPQTALECFAKIDNLDQYGDDIYWYQALCFVKLAERSPALRSKAARALQRAAQQTEDPERKAQAEQMLDDLSE